MSTRRLYSSVKRTEETVVRVEISDFSDVTYHNVSF